MSHLEEFPTKPPYSNTIVTQSDDTNNGDMVQLTAGSVGVVVASIALVALTTLWTGLRLHVRRIKSQPWVIDDYLTLIALIVFYGLVACNVVATHLGGAGHDPSALQPVHNLRMGQATFSIQILFAVCLGLIKISIIAMVQRTLCLRPLRIAAWVICGLCVCWIVLSTLVDISICKPIAMNWDPDTPGGQCGNRNAALAGIGFSGLLIDLFIFILPILTVYQLQLPHKVALYIIIAAGFSTILFGAMRLYFLMSMDSTTDVAYSQVNFLLYGTLEPGIAIMVASSPSLKPIFDNTIGRLWLLHNRKDSYGSRTTTGGSSGKGLAFARRDGFNEIIPTGVDGSEEYPSYNLELNGLRPATHQVTVTADQNHFPCFEERGLGRSRQDDMSDVTVGILVTDNTEVVWEPRVGAV